MGKTGKSMVAASHNRSSFHDFDPAAYLIGASIESLEKKRFNWSSYFLKGFKNLFLNFAA